MGTVLLKDSKLKSLKLSTNMFVERWIREDLKKPVMEIILVPPASRAVCRCLEASYLFSFQWVFPGFYTNHLLHRTKSGVCFSTSVLPFPFPGSSLNLLISAFVGVYSLCSNHPIHWEVKRERCDPKRQSSHFQPGNDSLSWKHCVK